MQNTNQTQSLLAHLPPIKRVRGGYLYDTQNRRYLDLWLHNGTLLQGHNDSGSIKLMKNTLSQTALMPYPNIWHERLMKTLQTQYQAKHIYIIEGDSHQAVTPFSEPWKNSNTGYYYLRAGYPLPSHLRVAKLALTLSGYHIILAFTDDTYLAERKTVLPAYLARTALKQLSLFTHTTIKTIEPASHQTPNWDHYGSYFQSSLHPENYRNAFLEALQQGILLPPGIEYTGMYISSLFSEGQQQQISKILHQ
ncbi:hypothetical protein PVA45_04710 [Entomospira entomophila]|uniref:Uncharacterized protein n=1 Tax=Entomospira entomophila TaxID=2719988 RepID=A0A968G908_9SPIO|nr:hypothetical protein [Entomospira entomophilus]NIZ40803.1 hypothetical protein [Entomospira entomophilus]WDI35015.1 hypothetical protein PVA45_04710 [Entomospira entomophilus]